MVLSGGLVHPAYGQPGEEMQNPSRCVPDIGKEVVTQEDILRHGFFRLADVLAFSARWSATSLDGYHWHTAPAGFPGGAERWSLYIDDIPVAPRVLGRNRLNALPISLSDVACIEIVSSADAQGPAWVRDGALRIYTISPKNGLSIQTGFAAGSEINDPGPFRYTLPEAINIDRAGPVNTASLSTGKNMWQAHATVRRDEQHVTDSALRERVWRLYNIPDTHPHIRTRALGFAGAFGPPPRKQRILTGFAHTGDIVFFPETGLEIPAVHRMALWGAAGALPLWRGGVVRYAVSSTRDALTERQNKENIDLDWAQRLLSAEADLRMHRVRLSGRAQAFRAETAQPLRDETLLDLQLFGGIDLTRRPQESMRLALEWTRRDRQHGAAAYASLRRRGFRLAGAYGAAPPDAGNLWFWQRRGYALPYGAFRDIPRERPPLPRRIALDAGWARLRTGGRRGPQGLSASLLVFYRGFRHEIRPEYALAPGSEQAGQSGFATVTRLVEGVRGHTAGISATITLRPLPGVRQRVSGTFEAVRRRHPPLLDHTDRTGAPIFSSALNTPNAPRNTRTAPTTAEPALNALTTQPSPTAAEPALNALTAQPSPTTAEPALNALTTQPSPTAAEPALNTLTTQPSPTAAEPAPRLRLVSVTEWTVAERFSLSAFLQYVSAMRWPEYRDATPETWRLPPRLLANITAAKRMAGDRLHVSLGLRNILNEPMRFHPAGAVFHMEFYFSVTARLTSTAGF